MSIANALLNFGLQVFRIADWVIRKIFVKIIGGPIRWLIDFFGPVVRPTRVALVLIVLCGLALGFTDQGHELARSLPLNPFQDIRRLFDWIIAFTVTIGTMTWWAVQSWWWARILLDRHIAAGGTRPRKLLEDWTPRAYAMRVYGIAAIPLAMDKRWGGVGFLIVVALLVLWILVRRRNPLSRVNKYLASQPSQRMVAGGVAAFSSFTRKGLVMLTLCVLLPAVMAILLTFWRTEVTFFLGTLAVTFIAMACILPTLAVLTITQAGSRAPVLVILLVYAGVVSAINSYFEWDNHTVRASEPMVQPTSSTLDQEYAAWREHNAGAADPMVLVYSAGGGLRAAYWTSALLSKLEERAPGFHCRVFAVSGVSGGSVGAVFWAGALQATASPGGDPCKKSSALGDKVNASLAKDYLASGLSGLLFNDFLAAFVPFKPWWKDRAVALEEAWEAGFRKELGSDALGKGFHDLWSSSDQVGWMPILLLNGTHQETGQRIITSNIAITDLQFPKAYDFFDVFDREIPASTAALNSARFTYVSPAGRIVDAEDKEQGHVIDGGYFENYGARTIADLYAALPQKPAKVLLVEIINDTDLKEADVDRCGTLKPETGDVWAGTVNEIVAPIKGMLMARQARGVVDARMAANLIASAKCNGGNEAQFFQLRLCPGMTPSPPLGWVMGEQSVENIRKLISGEFADGTAPADSLGKCAADLRAALDDLVKAIPK